VAESTKQDFEFLQQFEPDVFWQQHGKKIMAAVAVVVAVGLIAYYRQQQAVEQEQLAATRLAQASDTGTLRQLAQEFRGKGLAAQALMRLAEAESQAGKYKEAAAAYQEFLGMFPNHSLVASAQLGLAVAQEAQGNFELAKGQYEQLVNARPNSYTVVAAKLGAARCAEALGQTKEALQRYEEVKPVIQSSAWETEVGVRYLVLSRMTEVNTNVPAAFPK